MSIQKLKDRLESTPAYFVTQYITCPIFVFDLNNEIDGEKIVERAYDFKKEEYRHTIHQLVTNGFQTIPFAPRQYNLFTDLIKIIEQKANIATNSKYTIDHFWFVFSERGTEHAPHNHNILDKVMPLSAVYYPTDNEGSSPLIFNTFEQGKENEIVIPAKKNRLIIFHSQLYHMVPKCTSDINRISFSCNLRRIIGD